jgi:lysophospholipase L1-like esterase
MITKILRYIPIIDQVFRDNPILLPKKNGVKRIVTLGDSITEGSCSSNKKSKSYPSQLRKLLNDESKYEVINLGLGGRTMMKKGDLPYWNEPSF